MVYSKICLNQGNESAQPAISGSSVIDFHNKLKIRTYYVCIHINYNS